jgi:Ca2+-binding EF-hand superfamily protein
MAYDVLDADGSGSVDLADFALIYDVSCHPDYVSRKRSREEILGELLDVFDVGGEKDGKVHMPHM